MNFFIHGLMIVFLMLSTLSHAQTFPNKPIKIVTNLPVGAAPEVYIRKVSQQLEKKYQVPVIVENRPGAGGIIALEYYLSLPADGYSLFFGDFGAVVIMPILYQREVLIQQLTPLTNTYNTQWMIITPANIQNWDQLKKALQTKPVYGSWGVASGGHLCGAEVVAMLGVSAQHIPYKEFGPWFVDVVNGTLPFSCASVGSSQSYQKSGKLNYLATAGAQRHYFYKEIPTITELTGQTFFTGEASAPIMINKKVSDAIMNKLNTDLREIMTSQDIIEQTKVLGGISWFPSKGELTTALQQNRLTYKKLLDKFNITLK